MKKNKFLIAGLLIMFLFIALIRIGINTIAKEDARKKIQQVVDNSYVEDDLNIADLKDNIEKNINNSKVINKDTEKFPLHTVVDDYEFKIDEDGNVDDNIEKNEINNEINNESTNEIKKDEEEKNEEEKNEIVESEKNIVKYKDDEKIDKGITISTTKDGIVSISGKSIDNLFIKISNNIQVSNNSKTFEDWKKEDGIIIPQKKDIIERISILDNIVANGEVNVALRTEENEAIGILKLLNNETRYNTLLTKNVIANYIYIAKGTQIENIKFKVDIIEDIKNESEDYAETVTQKGIECTIDKEGKVKLNGTTKDRLFIKITNGIHMTSDGNKSIKLASTEPILFTKDQKINVLIEEIQGKYIATTNQEINFILRYKDGNIATKCKINSNNLNQEITLEKDITMEYIYISSGVTFENYIIKPNIN